MKRLLFVVVACATAIPITGEAAPLSACPKATLAVYDTMTDGCIFNNTLVFGLSLVANANPNVINIPDTSIMVNPETTPNGFGFQISSGWGVFTPDKFIDSVVSYSVQGLSGTKITGLYLSFNGTAFGTGIASDSLQFCRGADCSGNLSVSVPPGIFQGSTSFSGVDSLTVHDDILVSAGGNGGATISFVEKLLRINAPEPITMGLVGGALVGLALVKKRRAIS